MTGGAENTRIPLSVPDLRGNEAAYLVNCVETNWVSSAGSYVNDFEAAIAGYTGARRGAAIVNGTCALELALRLAGVGPGDTVIIPDWTFVATANAVCHTGATPHFVDITGDSWTLDPALVEQAVADASSRVAAIVPVHALGHPADMDPILEIGRRHGNSGRRRRGGRDRRHLPGKASRVIGIVRHDVQLQRQQAVDLRQRRHAGHR